MSANIEQISKMLEKLNQPNNIRQKQEVDTEGEMAALKKSIQGISDTHWKPSEEQMEALMLAIEGKCAPTSYMSRRLEDLYEGLVNAYGVQENYLNKPGCAQQEQLSEDLENAAIDYADYARKQPKDYAISSVADYDHGCIDGFKAGAEWQKEQMLKEAVEGYVNYYEDSGGILMAEAQVGCPYHIGDKVKIVIVKEDKK